MEKSPAQTFLLICLGGLIAQNFFNVIVEYFEFVENL